MISHAKTKMTKKQTNFRGCLICGLRCMASCYTERYIYSTSYNILRYTVQVTIY